MAEHAGDCRPQYVILAGVNGSGKSTFYHAGIWKDFVGGSHENMPWVNPDNILRSQCGRWNDVGSQIEAGREAIAQANRCLKSRQSFLQETTLSGHTALQRIRRARALGFATTMFYIGLSSPELANERIALRTRREGHGIPEEVVAKRYAAAHESFNKATRLCERVFVFDNTSSFQHIATWEDGFIGEWNAFPIETSWLYRMIDEELIAI